MHMQASEKEAFTRSVGAFVRKEVQAATAPLIARIAELEGRPSPVGIAEHVKTDGVLILKLTDGTEFDIRDGKDGRDGVDGANGVDGKDGRDGVDGKDGTPGADGVDGKPGDPGERGADGEDGKDGRDGQPGVPGRDGKDGAPGSDGVNGKDGLDGLGFDDLDYDGERTLRFVQGERVKEFRMPIILDRGIWKDGQAYERGDGVTWGGSFWIAQEATTEKPDSGKGWRLAVKRGRDAKSPPTRL